MYIIDHCSAEKEIFPFLTTWMDPEFIISEKTDRERQIPFDFTYMWQKNPNKPREKENRQVVVRRGGWRVDEIDEGSQKEQTSSYKINKSQAKTYFLSFK